MYHTRPGIASRLPLAFLLAACGGTPPAPEPLPAPAGPTAEEAKAFAAEANAALKEKWIAESQAAWAYATDITDAHEQAESAAREATMGWLTDAIPKAATFRDVPGVDADTARSLHLLRIAGTLPSPSDPAQRKQLAEIATRLGGVYGKGEYCVGEGEQKVCRDLGQLEEVLATSRDPAAQYEAWNGWHTVGPQMRADYQQFVTLGNEGAKEIGFTDMGELWRSGYDMPPAAFEAEVDRLWTQVEPLYKDLHCYTRNKLNATYGDAVAPKTGPIPAHLTGNMWAQSWENLYPILEPYPKEPDLDPTAALQKQQWDHLKMVKTAEGFFTSMGLDPLPATFWDRSMFLQPPDREVVCHASAWDVTFNDDLRIKMCIKPDYDNLVTLHHELGHDYYFHYYYQLPALYQAGANDGFHEAIGDAIALSMTPSYLQKIGLVSEVSPSKESIVNYQLQVALAKVAFLPFGRMIDQWRWDVFSGKIPPDQYNKGWWDLRLKYQGVAPTSPRDEAYFDPAGKYHIPGNTPYIRYFLAHILQFQFHEAMCKASGHTGPLDQCSVFGSTAAGDKLKAMLALGASKPWPEAMEAIAGTREMDARPMLEYFAPLHTWLKEQNAGQQCGW